MKRDVKSRHTTFSVIKNKHVKKNCLSYINNNKKYKQIVFIKINFW